MLERSSVSTKGARVLVTAMHMADAVSFLMRVASDSGLRGIAVRLGRVRASLIDITNEERRRRSLTRDRRGGRRRRLGYGNETPDNRPKYDG